MSWRNHPHGRRKTFAIVPYRNSYYRAYRQATLRGFPRKHLQFELLVHIQTDAYTTPSPPPTKDGRDGSKGPQGPPSGLPEGLAVHPAQSLALLAAAPSSSVHNNAPPLCPQLEKASVAPSFRPSILLFPFRVSSIRPT